MFRPNWPSSGVQVVMIKGSAAHCNPTVVDNLYMIQRIISLCNYL
jgi:hypothetical protein